jgi:hypothetical protein
MQSSVNMYVCSLSLSFFFVFVSNTHLKEFGPWIQVLNFINGLQDAMPSGVSLPFASPVDALASEQIEQLLSKCYLAESQSALFLQELNTFQEAAKQIAPETIHQRGGGSAFLWIQAPDATDGEMIVLPLDVALVFLAEQEAAGHQSRQLTTLVTWHFAVSVEGALAYNIPGPSDKSVKGYWLYFQNPRNRCHTVNVGLEVWSQILSRLHQLVGMPSGTTVSFPPLVVCIFFT